MNGARPEASAVGATRPLLPWVLWTAAALFYCYGVALRVAPSVFTDDLMRDFAIGAGVVGNMSAAYLYPYAALQIPLGVMLDRWGARRALTWMAALCAVGSVVFALSPNVQLAYVGRVAVGVGAGVALIGSLHIATVHLPVRRFAFASGAGLTAATVGAAAGQAPFALAADLLGWRGAMLVAAGVGAVIAVLLAVVWRFAPAQADDGDQHAAGRSRGSGTRTDLKPVVLNLQTWRIGAYGAAMAMPFFAFAMLWGVPFLATSYGLPDGIAALGTTAMLIGWGIGSPLCGWMVDRTGGEKPAMVGGALLCTATLTAVIYGPAMPFPAVCALLFVTGLAGGAMMLTFAVARTQQASELYGAVYGVVNMMVVGAGALSQPLIGWLLDRSWTGTVVDGVRVYGATEYSVAFAILPAAGVLACLVAATLPRR